MKKLFVFLLLGVFMIGFASADILNPSTWDDKVTFHEEGRNGKYGYYEINDTDFWFFNNKPIKTIELIENKYSVFTAWNVKEVEVFKPSKLFDKTNYLDKEQKKDKSNLLSSEVHLYREWQIKTRTINNQSCLTYETSANQTQICSEWQDTSYEEEYEGWSDWQIYNFQTVQEGLYQTKTIVTREYQNTGIIDWIDENEGHSLDKWATWWDSNWGFKRLINLTANVGNFSFIERINYSAGMNANFSDVRFLNSTETGELNFTIQNKVDSSYIVVRIFSQGEDNIYMYYGNSGAATSTESSFNTHLQPVSFWYLDEASGSVGDSINLNNGTNGGATTNITGKVNKAYDFNGVDENVDFGDASDFDFGTSDFSVGAWVYLDTNTAGRVIIGKTNGGTASSSYGWGLFMHNFGTPTNIVPQLIFATSVTHAQVIGNDVAFSTGTWVHIMAVVDRDNAANSKMYINGDATGTTTSAIASNTGSISNSANSKIASEGDNANWLNGSVDEPIIFNKTLTSTEVKQIFTYTEPTYTVGVEQALVEVTTTLISPENNANILNNTVEFNFTSIPIDTNLTNATLYIWLNNGTLLNTNFTTLSGNESINTTFTNTLDDGVYKWNAETCGENVNCSFQSSNNSFIVHVIPLTINISEPTGIIDYIKIGDNQTLSWILTEAGENLTEHVTNCSYTYNSVITYLPLNTCIVTNTTNFTYVLGVDTLTFNATDEFNLTSNATTTWEYIIAEINQTYNETIFETFSNDFRIDIKSLATSITNPKLIYQNGVDITYTTTLNIINSTHFYLNASVITNGSFAGNNSFYWNITLDGTEYSIPERNQTVLEINFSECDGSNNITYLSVDFLDELTLTAINGTIRNADFNYYVDDADAYKTFIFATAGNQNQYDFCFSPGNATIINDFSISYYGDGYPERTYGSVFELTNITTNLTLNLLDDSSGIYATFGFIDATSKVGLSDVNVLIYEGVNLVVEKITDDSGLISEWLNPNILYEVQYTKIGYEGGSQSHRPISTDTINIEMASDSLVSSPSITNGLVTYYYPQLTSLDDDTNYSFGFYTSEGEESISLMKFTIYDEDGNTIYEAEQSGDGNMSQQLINTTQNKTFLGQYEITGEDDGYWIFYRTYYITVITSTDYSLSQWGLSFDTYFPSDDRTTLTQLIWFILWLIFTISGFAYGYNGSYSTQEDYRNNTSAQTRSNTSVGLFFAFIISWVFCYFNMIPVNIGLNPLLIPQDFLEQYFMAILFLVVLVSDVASSLYKHSRRGT